MTEESFDVVNLVAGYGRVGVISDVTFTMAPGEMVAMVGRNGAGKTTSLSAVAGLRYGRSGGSVRLGGRDLSNASPSELVKAGVKLVPEGRRIFREMSVAENLRLGAFLRRRQPQSELTNDLERVFTLFPALKRDYNKPALSLSGGQQQMVAIGQALMARPRFLLLDEPSSGVAPVLVDEMYATFRELANDGIGILIVDQNVERVIESTSRFYVIENGRTVADGRSADPQVLERVTRIVLGSVEHTQEMLDSLS